MKQVRKPMFDGRPMDPADAVQVLLRPHRRWRPAEMKKCQIYLRVYLLAWQYPCPRASQRLLHAKGSNLCLRLDLDQVSEPYLEKRCLATTPRPAWLLVHPLHRELKSGLGETEQKEG